MASGRTLKAVEKFWETHTCGRQFVQSEYLSPAFFEEYRRFRYTKEHHLDTLIDWESARGRNVLEVGLGLGADATRWARHAQSFAGVDLTEESVQATGRHFDILGLKGEIRRGDVEELGLPDQSFDIVFSHGVLHHTTRIDAALRELHRVLRDDGELILMLYARDSLNYWLRIQGYLRARFLFELMRRSLGRRLGGLWEVHARNLDEIGWRYFSWEEWPHHCTDGPECTIANTYTGRDVRRLLRGAGFRVRQMKKAHLPLGLAPGLERALASVMGFYRFVWAVKDPRGHA